MSRIPCIAFVLCSLIAAAAPAQIKVPVIRSEPAQQKPHDAAAVNQLPEIKIRSLRLGCLGTDFATLRLITADGTHTLNYSCFPYTCAADTRTCRTGCSADAECTAGTVCSDGKCVIPVARCNADRSASVSALGTDVCSPYTCEAASGRCQRDCRTSNDCSGGFVCDVAARLCVAAPR